MLDPACDKQQRSPSSTRSFIVEKCHRLATAELLNVPSVTDLCQRLQVSRRTVQSSFRAVAETTPLNYLRSVRLNGVRRTLMTTRARASCFHLATPPPNGVLYHLSDFARGVPGAVRRLPSQTHPRRHHRVRARLNKDLE